MATTTYRVREYPLEVEPTGDAAYFSKGWHPANDFVEAANFEAECADHNLFSPEDVNYEVWRCVPGQPDDDFAIYFHLATLGQPGAFPVTVVGG